MRRRGNMPASRSIQRSAAFLGDLAGQFEVSICQVSTAIPRLELRLAASTSSDGCPGSLDLAADHVSRGGELPSARAVGCCELPQLHKSRHTTRLRFTSRPQQPVSTGASTAGGCYNAVNSTHDRRWAGWLMCSKSTVAPCEYHAPPANNALT